MIKLIVRRLSLAALILVLAAGSAQAADWALDNAASKLNFISIKAGSVAESHTFGSLQGHINAAGDVELAIDLDSVNTAIDIRNERMRKELFNTASHPKASVKTKVDAAALDALATGQSMATSVESMLDLSGTQSNITAELNVMKLNDTTLVVATSKPILLNAANLGLDKGVEKLRELAGLPSISLAVPVDFSLVFTAR